MTMTYPNEVPRIGSKLTTSKPLLVDLFCSAGGGSMGYSRAGFEVVGVDIKPQPRYPFEFHQADAFEFLADHAHEFDAIAASPECRDHTPLTSVAGFKGTAWQLGEIIKLLEDTSKPYIVENVGAARFPEEFPHNLVLCGDRHFGLRTVRHRKFRCVGFDVPQPAHPVGHSRPTSTKNRVAALADGYNISVTGDVGVHVGVPCMGIDWMTGKELSQAIPPVYTEYIGRKLIGHIGMEAA